MQIGPNRLTILLGRQLTNFASCSQRWPFSSPQQAMLLPKYPLFCAAR